jgi:DHA2 family methylenomycin A resistance protein-like MFS transporter
MSSTDTRQISSRTNPDSRSPLLALVVICAGYFLVILDAMVVNVAVPSIGHELHGGVAGLQWVVDAYTLSFAGLLLAGGALAERLGARPVFTGGVAVFAAASAACGLAPTLAVLIAARFVQGAGAAVLVPSSLVLLQAAYPTREGRSRALGVWGSIGGIGAAAGPIVGGVLVSWWSWRGVFFINLPVAVAALALAGRALPAAPRRPRALDLPGQVLAIATLALLTAALVQAGRAGWLSPVILAGLAAALVAAFAFILIEHRSPDPMLPLELFARPSFRSGTLVGFLINLGLYGQLFVTSLYFQDIRGYSALRTGLVMLPEAALLVVASTLSGRIMARTGPRTPMLAGLLLGGAGFLGIAAAITSAPYVILAVTFGAAGFGMALTMPAATAAVMEAAPPDRGGIASGVVNAARQAGGVLGVALLGSLVSGRAHFTGGLHLGIAASAVAFFTGAAVTVTGVGRLGQEAANTPSPSAQE